MSHISYPTYPNPFYEWENNVSNFPCMIVTQIDNIIMETGVNNFDEVFLVLEDLTNKYEYFDKIEIHCKSCIIIHDDPYLLQLSLMNLIAKDIPFVDMFNMWQFTETLQ